MFLEAFYQIAKEYPNLKSDDVIVDDLAMKMVATPNAFDVVILPNLQVRNFPHLFPPSFLYYFRFSTIG
jgi:hypothetical protein